MIAALYLFIAHVLFGFVGIGVLIGFAAIAYLTVLEVLGL